MTQVQGIVADVRQWPIDLSAKESLLDRARIRVAREKDLSTSVTTAHYAPASLGQTPYVALPGVGTVVFRRCGWGC
jgi:hypothetical protein